MELDCVCFSHLRWNFVYQRPQHLLSRFSNYFRVFYIEEPLFNADEDGYEINFTEEKVWVIVPKLKGNAEGENIIHRQKDIISQVFNDNLITKYLFWYYTPMALQYTEDLEPEIIIYDCMDELSAFKFAPPLLTKLEKQLFQKADIVFTGGYSLYHAKKNQHHNIYPFPSSIDKEHFIQARFVKTEPEDQKNIAFPRLGFFGVLDERFDLQLIKEAALKKPEWQFVLIGPVVKINPNDLPRLDNIHYLGSKSYQQLPSYVSGWDIALVPFALNESTKYISPTKTPEYLAAGKNVISTAIEDVINPYEKKGLVNIVHNSDEFVAAAENVLSMNDDEQKKWLDKVDEFLKDISWNETWHKMFMIVKNELNKKRKISNRKMKIYV